MEDHSSKESVESQGSTRTTKTFEEAEMIFIDLFFIIMIYRSV